MSTRSVIARLLPSLGTERKDENTFYHQFAGRYHHFDGYPTGLGKGLWDIYKNVFHSNLDAMLKYLLDDHPAGWSNIIGCDFTLSPGYIDGARSKGNQPRCYCHGDRNEEGYLYTEKTVFGDEWTDIEYLYLFNIQNNTMLVVDTDTKKVLSEVALNTDTEPNWEQMEYSLTSHN